jgi:C4-dicarboxylate-specific signal transduction histidine kinase
MDLAMRRAYGLTQPAFEAAWRSRTMHRYGVLAVIANVSLLFAMFAFLLLPLVWLRRRRDRRRMDALRAAEAASERAASERAATERAASEAAAIEAALRSLPGERSDFP